MRRRISAVIVNLTAAMAAEPLSYGLKGADWAETVPGAEKCGTGKEQSPINIDPKSQDDIDFSDKMELNGYGYQDFSV